MRNPDFVAEFLVFQSEQAREKYNHLIFSPRKTVQ